MGKLVKISHPHHLEKINTVKKLLLTYKNILIETYHNGYIEKIDGVNIPVRWSVSDNLFVIDRNDKQYPNGVNISNIDYAFKERDSLIEGGKKILHNVNQDNFIEFAKKFNLTKNERRFLFFEFINKKTNIIDYEDERIYLVGLYLKKNNLYMSIDSSVTFLSEFSNSFSFLSKNNIAKIKESYYDVFNKSLTSIKKEKLEVIVENKKVILSIDEYVESNCSFNNIIKIKKNKVNDTSINLYRNIINNNLNLNLNEFNKIKNGILSTHLNLLFGNYIKNYTNISGEGIIINTGFFKNNNVKLVGDFILKNNESNFFKKENNIINNELQTPILPFKF